MALSSPTTAFLLFLVVAVPVILEVKYSIALEFNFYGNTYPQRRRSSRSLLCSISMRTALSLLACSDCISTIGCDASVLLDSTIGNKAEKEAPPNLTLRGFELIDAIKAKIETTCPRIVSCADILALATREAVAFTGGSSYALPTDRRDRLVSRAFKVHVPGPSLSIDQAVASFKTINLDIDDLTTLLGENKFN